ncbi:NHL repeat-containing protein [Magnetospira sp. QH-2]|uniref:NHL repeat-containing protein n=1 Tax=Magnetospira sp. (strain QH-2) TaxID=1288970 RepID=UPI0003E8197F|nr:NHL repeat-containing protein [Magnetospira sp. QH-2]CCQ73300.1 Exported protein of unknown function [Magnetospira sp. QH-2]
MRYVFLMLAALWMRPTEASEWRFEFLRASDAVLGDPHDLHLSPDGRYLYVSDVDNDRVAVLDPESLELVGSFGAGEQSGTHDIDLDEAGKAYVADTNSGRVLIYEVSGSQGKLVGDLSGRLRGPEGVLAHPNGRIYAAGAWSGNVVAYERGKVVAELTGLWSPHDLELAADGDIWLAEAGSDRLLLLSPELKILRELSGAPYHFNGVRYLDRMTDGTLIAADKDSHRVLVIGADGALLSVLGSGEAGRGPNQFTTPEGVAIKGDRVWLSDSGNDRVVLYRIRRDG